MKRLIVLLIVIAGGLAAAAFTVPTNAASVNGSGISQQQLNTDLQAIAKSPDYQCFLNAEEAVGTQGQTGLPSIKGSGQLTDNGAHSTASTAFVDNYLGTQIGHQLVLQLAARRHLSVSTQDLATARGALEAQVTTILSDVTGSKYACGSTAQPLSAQEVVASMPTSFVDENVHFDAVVSVFERDLAGVGSSTADLEDYFNTHTAEFDSACFTVAEYSSESAAEAAVAAVAAGTPFAQVAAQQSGGGPQGCDILYGVASALPTLKNLALNTVSAPIAEGSTYLLVEITSKSPTSFTKAKSEVQSAVQAAGANKAQSLIDAAEKKATISVDQQFGQWTSSKAVILPPPSPPSGEVLNPLVNGVAPATSQGAASSTGLSS